MHKIAHHMRGVKYHMITWKRHHSDAELHLPTLALRSKESMLFEPYYRADRYIFTCAGQSQSTLIKLPSILGLIWDCLVELDISPSELMHDTQVEEFLASVFRLLLYGGSASTARGFDISALKWAPRSGSVVRGYGAAFDQFVSRRTKSADDDDLFLSRCPGLYRGSFRVAGNKRDSSPFLAVAHLKKGSNKSVGPMVQEATPGLLDKLAPKLEKRAPYGTSPTKRFPTEHLIGFLSKAFLERDPTGCFAARLLLGGCRGSEVINMWVDDLEIDRTGRLRGYLRCPLSYIEPGAAKSRKDLLLTKYEMQPRPLSHGRLRAGFKSPALGDDNSAPIYWLPGSEDFLRTSFGIYILNVRAPAMAKRRMLGLPDHPYLLVFPRSIPHLKIEVGDPYTLSAFRGSWSRAVKRFGSSDEVPFSEAAKYLGTTIHGVRHYCGKTWLKDGASLKETQKVLHHCSILSTSVYTIPDDDEIHRQAELVKQRLKNGDLDNNFRNFDDLSDAVRSYSEQAIAGLGSWRRF